MLGAGPGNMVVLELETVYAQAAPHTKLLNKRFVGAHHWLGPLKEALVARLAADKVRTRSTAHLRATACALRSRLYGYLPEPSQRRYL